MGFDFSFKTNNDQNRNRYRAEEEKKYDPTFEDDHSEGYTNVQNDSHMLRFHRDIFRSGLETLM